MAQSGVKVDDSVIDLYNTKMKITSTKTKSGKIPFMIFKIDDGKVKIDVEGEKGQTFDDFREILNSVDNECRYAIYDLEYSVEGEGTRTALIFITWTLESCPVKQKMVYAATQESVKKALTGIKSLPIHDAHDLTIDALIERAKQG